MLRKTSRCVECISSTNQLDLARSGQAAPSAAGQWNSAGEIARKENQMTTDHFPLKRIRLSDIFDGRLAAFGIHEHSKPGSTTRQSRCLTDECDFLWVFGNDDGVVSCLTCWFPNDETHI